VRDFSDMVLAAQGYGGDEVALAARPLAAPA
jgi:hypothetical protein